MRKLRLNSRASRLRLPGLIKDSFQVKALPLEELFCPVRDVPVFSDELRDSIDGSGLHNPIIVVRGPLEDLIEYYREREWSKKNLPDTPIVNCVWGGTNRISAAQKLGYTHIDCVLIPDFFLAMRLQDLQRNAYSAIRGTEDGSTSEVGTT